MIRTVRSLLRSFFCAIAFLLGLGTACWAIHGSLPFPDVPLARAKVEYFARHHDDYDTLFVGSSRIYYQIIPALFDQLTAEGGRPTKSFNAAIAGMRPPEDAYYLDYLLRTPPQHLRWVFIELAGMRTSVDSDKIGTIRAVYWHDWERLRLLWERALYLRPDPKKHKWQHNFETRMVPLGEFFDHVRLFIRAQSNLGRGGQLGSRLVSDRPPRGVPSESVLGKDFAGWVRTGRPEVMVGPELAAYDKALADRQVEKPVGDMMDPISQKALEIMIAKIEKLGATPVLVVPPTTNKRNFIPTPERAKKTLVLNFCDLEKFPELYERRYRLDTDHLNTDGADVFTRVFVRQWLEESKARP